MSMDSRFDSSWWISSLAIIHCIVTIVTVISPKYNLGSCILPDDRVSGQSEWMPPSTPLHPSLVKVVVDVECSGRCNGEDFLSFFLPSFLCFSLLPCSAFFSLWVRRVHPPWNGSGRVFLEWTCPIVHSSQQIEERRPIIFDDITSGKELSREDIRECLALLEDEWKGLNDASHTWKNRVDNALANMRIFQTDLKTAQSRWAIIGLFPFTNP